MAFHHRISGSGVMSVALGPARSFQLEEVRLHLSAAGGAGDFTATVQSAHGSQYNIVLNTQDMTAATDEHYQPTRPVIIADGDTLLFEWANASSRQWGLEVVYR